MPHVGYAVSSAVFGHVEDHRARVQLRGRVPIDWPAAVMLELGNRPRACGLGRNFPAGPRLGVLLHLVQSHPHALPVGIADPVIASDERSDGHRYRRAAMALAFEGIAKRNARLEATTNELAVL